MSKRSVFPFMLKLIVFFIVFIACAAGLLIAAKRAGARNDLPINAAPARTLVIDAGHGGPDGGAVGVGGSVEKDIDLSIA